MTLQEKMLGQLRPANTTAASLYAPAANVTAIIKTIFVANTSSSVALFCIFVHNTGTTYDETTALFWDVSIASHATVELNSFLAMNNSAGHLAVRTDTANALTFTFF